MRRSERLAAAGRAEAAQRGAAVAKRFAPPARRGTPARPKRAGGRGRRRLGGASDEPAKPLAPFRFTRGRAKLSNREPVQPNSRALESTALPKITQVFVLAAERRVGGRCRVFLTCRGWSVVLVVILAGGRLRAMARGARQAARPPPSKPADMTCFLKFSARYAEKTDEDPCHPASLRNRPGLWPVGSALSFVREHRS